MCKSMGEYVITVTIQNKPSLRDPEGETILKDLIVKNGFNGVKSIRTAKQLRFVVEATDGPDARQLVSKICSDLRIYNPIVSICSIGIEGGRR